MRVVHDKETDTLTFVFREGTVDDSEEQRPGVILDYDAQGQLVSLELLDASKRVQDPLSITLETKVS